jgi:site-specific recombinase XerD
MSEVVPRKKSFLDDQNVKYSKSTYQNRKSGVNKFETWLEEKGYTPDELDSFEFDKFFKWMIREDGADLTELSAYQYLNAIRKYYDYNPDFESNPAREIDTSWLEYEVKHDKPNLTQEELRALVDSAQSKRGEALLSLMASTGMRVGEAVSVTMEQLDLDERMIENIETIKTDFGKRTVYFDRSTRRILRDYINKGYRDKYASDSDYLFTSNGEKQEHMSTDIARKEFIRAVAECDEIQDKVEYHSMGGDDDDRMRCSVGTHILRRSFCQNWVDNGGDIMSLKNVVGWEHLETAKNYLDASVDREKRDKHGVRL